MAQCPTSQRYCDKMVPSDNIYSTFHEKMELT